MTSEPHAGVSTEGQGFVAIDVETANPDLASICQIGIVRFVDGEIRESWQTLVNPEDYFDAFNTSIHGIEECDVVHAPRFPEVVPDLAKMLGGHIVVSHMPFDRTALIRVHDKYSLPHIDYTWLDSAAVCRRAWPQFRRRGYGLANVAEWCEIEFRHHNAEDDARAAGLVLVHAMRDTGLGVQDWLTRVKEPIDPSAAAAATSRSGNPDGPLVGEVVVFTGALSMPRRTAANLAASAGCDVATSIGKQTTVVVVGDQDLRRLAGHERSAKIRKAEMLISKGQAIRILGESDFFALVDAKEL
ncbi:MAG: exonuclease domain-containing protein [Acidimicrobiales bacterium]